MGGGGGGVRGGTCRKLEVYGISVSRYSQLYDIMNSASMSGTEVHMI